MKSIKKKFVIFLSIITVSVYSINVYADEELYRVSGFITGCSSKHSVHVILYDEASFKDMTAIQENIYEPTGNGECKIPFSLNTPQGSYTIAAFEDENNNNKLDFFFFIPKEPSGFFRTFSGMGAPKFEKLKFDVDGDFFDADVELQ